MKLYFKPILAVFLLNNMLINTTFADDNLYPFWTDKDGYINAKGEVIIKPQFESSNFFAGNLAPVMLNGKYGFVSKTGKMVFKPQFDHISWLGNGLFSVKQNNKYGIINNSGVITAPIKYDYIRDIEKNSEVSEVWLNGLSGLYNKNGKIVLEPRYKYIYSANAHGVIKVLDQNNKTGYINTKGKVLIAPQFDDLGGIYLHGDLIITYSNKKQGILSAKGDIISPPKYDAIYSFYEGLAAAQLDGKPTEYEPKSGWGFIDQNGKSVIKHQFDEVDHFNNGIAAVKKDDKWGYIDTKGKWVIEPRFSLAQPFSDEGWAIAAIDQKGWDIYGFIDRRGEWVIKPQFNSLGTFANNGLAEAQSFNDYAYGYINKKGEWVIEPIYTDTSRFDRYSLARIGGSGNIRIIDATGETVISGFDQMGEFNADGIAWFYTYGEHTNMGLIDTKGNIILDGLDGIDFDSYKRHEAAVIRKDSKFGLINLKGEVLLEPKYNNIAYFDDNNQTSISTMDKNGVKYGVVNTQGNIVIPIVYDQPIRFYNNGLAIAKIGEKHGVINLRGEWIIKPRFGYIFGDSLAQNGLILALENPPPSQDSEWYYLDQQGSVVFYSETFNNKRIAKKVDGTIIWGQK